MNSGTARQARTSTSGRRTARRHDSSLPVEVTSFVGRASELSAIRSRLADGARFVTLTGVGGVGKSRIAVNAAHQLLPAIADGVHFVELTRLRHGELLAQAILESAGIAPVAGEAPAESLVRGLSGKDVLLVLDNCDHLHLACAELVPLLLQRTSGVAILATSRKPIGSSGEWVVPVAPLTTTHSSAGEREAVQLFVDRVQAVRPDFLADSCNFEQITALCRRLDGLPLAIELAARRLRVLSLEQLSVRLEDRFRVLTEAPNDVPERHRSLRAVFDFSYEQCSAAEQVLWARVSVFVGSASLEALESICESDSEAGSSVLDLVDGLVQRSILVPTETSSGPRYWMLESVREYGVQRLANMANGVEAVRFQRRHREFYARVAQLAEREWFGPGQDEWCDRLRAELPNLRAAMESFLDEDDRSGAAEMATTLWPLWIAHGQLHEGRMWFHRTMAGELDDAKALAVSAWIDLLEGDVEVAESRLTSSVTLARARGDDRSLAQA